MDAYFAQLLQDRLDANSSLWRTYNAQRTIDSLERPNPAEIAEQIEAADSELAELNAELASKHAYLKAVLKWQDRTRKCMLAIPALERIKLSMLDVCEQSLLDGRTDVPLSEMMNLEDKYEALVNELVAEDVYQETRAEYDTRIKDKVAHQNNVLSHISKFC